MFRKVLLVVLLLARMALPPLSAQEKPAAKPAPTSPDFSKQAYLIERLSTRVTAESDGTGTRERTAEVRVVSEAGVKAFAVLTLPYTSANEVMEFDYVRVRKPDGTVVKTPDYNIQDMPAEVSRIAPLYSDVHEKHVAVKGLAVGDVLEYVVRVRVVKAQVPGHFWYEDSFNKTSIVRDERLEISVPADKYVKVVSPEFKPQVTQEGTRRVYRWASSNLVVPDKDPDEIPRRTPPNPDVQLTTFSSWEDVGRWYGGLQKEQLAVTPAIQAKASELTKGLQLDDEKIHALYNFVSLKYHYIGLDFGIGRYRPHAADDVLDNGYGDCKDKHTLLAALLKAVGIEAWPVLINGARKLDPDVPSPAQFNHVITIVPRGKQFLWLDTTPEVAPYGLLMQQLRNKQALVIPGDQPPKLMTTPESPAQPQRQEFSMQGKLSADGTFTGHAEQIYEGDGAVVFRAVFRQVPESQWKDLMQRISQSQNFGGDVSEVKVSPPEEIDKPFMISYNYVRKDFGDFENNHTTAPLPPMGLEAYKGSKDRKPQEPVVLGALGKIIYRSRLELPEGYTAQLPAPCHLSESYAEYDDTARSENGVITTTRELLIKKTEVPLSDWEGYRKFGRSLADDEFNYIQLTRPSAVVTGKNEGDGKKGDVAKGLGEGDMFRQADPRLDDMFREGTDALQQRDFQRAQELFEKIIAKNPDYKGAHFNLGASLLAQRNVTDGLEEVRKEERVSPEDARPYRLLAEFLTQMGRRDEAIDQWHKLLKVDPQNRTAASTLGTLLYDSGKYPEAVEVLEAAVKMAPDSPGLRFQLGNAYLKTGQNDKAAARMREAVEQKPDDPVMLNNVAYSLADNKLNLDLARQYAEKAVKILEEQTQAAESGRDGGLRTTYLLTLTWDTLGWVYFRQGDLKSAEGLVRAAWLLGEHDDVAEHLGEIYEKEGKTAQAARAYEHALTVSSAPSVFGGSPSEVAKAYQDRKNEIVARYEKLTGKKPPLAEIHRLPNGGWTQTPAEQLRHTREVKLSNEKKLEGSAEFVVVLKPGKVESAEFLRGKESLETLSKQLIDAHSPLEFPPDSAATLTVRMNVICQPASPCVATLVPPVPAPSQTPSMGN